MRKFIKISTFFLIISGLFGCSPSVEYSSEQIAEKMKELGCDTFQNEVYMVVTTAFEYKQITQPQGKKYIEDVRAAAAKWVMENISKKEINNLMSANADFMYSSVTGGVDGNFDAASICDSAFGAAVKTVPFPGK